MPQLDSQSIQKLGYGWDNTIFLVGTDYVFRFQEEKLPFILSAINLANFVKSLHAFPVEIAEENGVQHYHRNLTDIAMRKEKLHKFISNIAHHFSEEEYRELLNYLEQLRTEKVKPKNVFLHGDLHFKNMLVDENGIVSGIIDWGDIHIGHPACDLNVAYSFLPLDARSEFFKEYGDVDEETKILARLIAIYFPILIMMQAIDDKDEKLVAEAKANIKRALSD